MPNALNTVFAGKIGMIGYELPEEARSGGEIKVKVFWRSLARTTEDYRFVTYLEDKTGRVWSQVDRVPLTLDYPTSRWVPGEYLTDQYLFPIPAGTPPGLYELKVRLYSAGSGDGLKLDGQTGDVASLAEIEVQKAGPKEAGRALRSLTCEAKQSLGRGISLLRYALAREDALTGQSIDLYLLWQAQQRPGVRYDVLFQLVNTANVAVQEVRLPIGDWYTTDRWDAGEIVGQYLSLPASSNTEAGTYHVRARLVLRDIRGAREQTGDSVDLGRILIRSPERSFALPVPQYAYRVDLGGVITFLGYDASSWRAVRGEKLTIHPYWQAQTEMSISYKGFVHLLGPDGRVVAQRDEFPLHGQRPTADWKKGEVIRDEWELAVPGDISPGEYRLEVGMYDPESGQRLTLRSADGSQTVSATLAISGNAVLLNEVLTIR